MKKNWFLLTLFFCGGLQAYDFEKYNSALALTVTKHDGHKYTCSAVAISPKKLLTAAHCLDDAYHVQVVQEFQVGEENTYFSVRNYEIHPSYNPSKSFYLFDLAKITLNKPLPVKINILPIGNLSSHEGELIRIGFGSRGGVSSRTMVSHITEFSDDGDIITMKDLYSYSGDSGGPVFQKIGSKIHLLGIHSTLENEVSYNVVIESFIDWIN